MAGREAAQGARQPPSSHPLCFVISKSLAAGLDWLADCSERDVVEAGLRWINADRKSRAGHVGQVIGRCVNFHKLDATELVWLSNAEPYILDDQTLRDHIYEANWSARLHTLCSRTN